MSVAIGMFGLGGIWIGLDWIGLVDLIRYGRIFSLSIYIFTSSVRALA